MRYPGDTGGLDSHGHGHGHGDAHDEGDMDDLSGPDHDVGFHGAHEDSHVGQYIAPSSTYHKRLNRFIGRRVRPCFGWGHPSLLFAFR